MSCISTRSYGGQRTGAEVEFRRETAEVQEVLEEAKLQLGNLADKEETIQSALPRLEGAKKTKAQSTLRSLRKKKRELEKTINISNSRIATLETNYRDNLMRIDEDEHEANARIFVNEISKNGVNQNSADFVRGEKPTADNHHAENFEKSFERIQLSNDVLKEKRKQNSQGKENDDHIGRENVMEEERDECRTGAWVQRHLHHREDHQQPIHSTGRDDRFIARQTIGKDLPTFGGAPETWPAFIAQYNYTTEACRFTNGENLFRLEKSLKGTAKELVQPLLTSPNNVPKIMEKLEMIFGRPEFIIESLMIKARDEPPPSHGRPGSIIAYENTVSGIVTTIKNLNRDEYLMNPSLLKQLVFKMDSIYKEKWGDYQVYRDIRTPTLEDFGNWLEGARNSALLVTSAGDLLGWNKPDDRKRREHFHVAAYPELEKKKYSCWFCDNTGHTLGDCKKIQSETVESRWKWVRDNGRCFCCLGKGHSVENCKRKRECSVDNCRKHHHPLLHNETTVRKHEDHDTTRNEFFATQPTSEYAEMSTVPTKRSHVIGSTGVLYGEKLLKFAPVTLIGPGGEMNCYVFMDEGATCSILDADAAGKIGCKGPREPLELKWTNGITRYHPESEIVNLKIKAENGTVYQITGAQTIKDPELPVQSIDVKNIKAKYPHLGRAKCVSYFNERPLLLLGEDYIHLTVSREVLTVQPQDLHTPIASRTLLGWVIHGPSGIGGGNRTYSFTVIKNKLQNEDNDIHDLIKESFKLEAFGLEVRPRKLKSDEDKRAEFLLESTSKKISCNQWETGLLWKTDHPIFPDSKQDAFVRLRGIEKKMDKNKEFSDWYLDKIKYYDDNGYCKLLTPEKAAMQNEKAFYMPHFAACNVNNPGKLRWVCDAAAKSKGVSLNDQLLKGPDQLNSLPGILLRFRRKKIAFGGDVKEMFHQIKVKEEDRDSQRFLFRGLDRDREPDIYCMEVLIFGAASSPCSAQYVMKRNAEEWRESCPETVAAIKRNIFMDDYLDCEENVEAAAERIKEVIKIQSAGGMEMMKWITNSKDVLDTIPEERRALTANLDVTKDSNELGVQRVLGIHWAGKEDQLVFKVNLPKVSPDIIDGSRRPTKREALRLAMSLFDPIGIIAHYTIRVKILLQVIWKEGTDWDESVTENCWKIWQRWIGQLMQVENVKIPRCYCATLFGAKEVNLHVFTDSSSEAYSSVAYLQIIHDSGIEVAFVIGKARVAPVKPQTIPKLELQGALMGTRIASTIIEELDLDLNSTTFWTDSRIILCWIRSDTRKFKMFVSSRVGEILESTDVSQWKWVPTLENPADDGTRDKLTTELSSSCRWLIGPKFLHLGPEKYPIELNTAIIPEDLEIKKEISCIISAGPPVLNYKNYSTYLRIVRITAWILKWKRRLETKNEGNVPTPYLSVEDIKLAKMVLIKRSQQESFATEIAALQKRLTVEKTSRIYQFQPFLDDNGIMRMCSRVKGYTPIILDGSHPVSRLIIMEYHCEMLHGSKETVIQTVRKTFWIPKLRSCVNIVTRSCMRCKVEGAKIHQPIMGKLPDCRLMANFRPFHHCGVDYYGPVTVAINRKHEKRYGVLFVCMTTGAVMLDFVKYLNTDSCIMAINRLVARRGGKPAVILSDNGTNFVGANKELKKSLENVDDEKIAESVANAGIEWKFIPPRSPHFGGRWERQIKTVKSALSKTLTYYQKRIPTEEIMRTLLLEVEYLVNSRPLTHISVDGNEDEALTPNHFLFGAEAVMKPWGKFTENDVILRQEWRKLNRMADCFWERWISEYLPTLAERRKWNENARPIKLGDLVFIVEPGAPRGSWIRGKVEKLYPGKDGIVRVVDVKTAGGMFRRSVSKCAVIDIGVDQGPSP